MKSVAAFVLVLLGSIGQGILALFFGVISSLFFLGANSGSELGAAAFFSIIPFLIGVSSFVTFVSSFLLISDKTLKAGSIVALVFGFTNLLILIGGILGLIASSKPSVSSNTVKVVQNSAVKQTIKEEKPTKSTSNVGRLQEDSKTWAFLGVFLTWIGYLIIVNTEHKNDSYVLFYAKQGLVLGIASLVFSFASFPLMFIPLAGLVTWVASIALLVLEILAIINSFSGEMRPLPLLGGFIK